MLAVPCMESITKCLGDASVEEKKEGKSFDELWPVYEAKMKAEGLSAAAIAAFKYNFGVLTSGADLNIPESTCVSHPATPSPALAADTCDSRRTWRRSPNFPTPLRIMAVDALPTYEALKGEKPALLKETVMVKLNGGLGTGMGLEKAKSLLELKDGMTFLDFIAKQVTDMRSKFGVPLAFMLMNSFATSADTLAHLSKYKDLQSEGLPLEFCQV